MVNKRFSFVGESNESPIYKKFSKLNKTIARSGSDFRITKQICTASPQNKLSEFRMIRPDLLQKRLEKFKAG